MTKINLQQTIADAYTRKFHFLSIKVDTVWSEAYEIKAYRDNHFAELASICEGIIGDAELSILDDTGAEEYVLIYENNKTNNEGVVVMNKTVLRQELKRYGVKLSPADFKESSVALLEVMLDNAKAKVEAEKTVVTVEQPQQSQSVVPVMSLDELMANVTANLDVTRLVGKQVIQSEANVKNHVTQSSQEVINALSKKIDDLVAVVNGQATTVNYSNVTNPNQTNSQYNQKAATLKPLGQVRNDKTGQMENYFGICSVCGSKIKSAKVVEFSMQRFGKVVCYAHQGQQQSAPKDKATVTHKCMYCGTDAEFENVATFLKLSKYAKSQGLAPCAHIACWKAAKATIVNVNEHMASQENLADTTPIQKPSDVIIPEGNIWMQSPTNNVDDNNAAY